MPLTLFYHPLASFCQKVIIALNEYGVPCERRLIDLGNETDRAELAAVWPLTKFPVLRDDERDRNIPETTVIIEYLEHYAGSSSSLIPQDFDTALDVRLWDRVFDNYVQIPMQAIVADRMTGKNSDMSAQRAALHRAYRLIEQRLAGRVWIAGDTFSMADCAAVPALFFAMTLENFPADCPLLAAYFERLIARPSVQAMFDDARPSFKLYPFASNIPARFL